MPTVLVINGRLRVMIRTNDHNPPHVHVEYGTGSTKSHAKIDIETLEIGEVRNFSTKDLKAITNILKLHHDELVDAWE